MLSQTCHKAGACSCCSIAPVTGHGTLCVDPSVVEEQVIYRSVSHKTLIRWPVGSEDLTKVMDSHSYTHTGTLNDNLIHWFGPSVGLLQLC